MTLSRGNKSKFSFTSFISKAYNNAFGVAVSYASTPYNSFSNAISGIYNFDYKQCFVSKFYGSSQFWNNPVNNTMQKIFNLNSNILFISQPENTNNKTLQMVAQSDDILEMDRAQSTIKNKDCLNQIVEPILQGAELSFEEIVKPRKNGNNLLHKAAFNNDVEFIAETLKKNLDDENKETLLMESTNNNGLTFLDIAYVNNNILVICKVIEIFDSHNTLPSVQYDGNKMITQASYDMWLFLTRDNKPFPVDITKILSFVEQSAELSQYPSDLTLFGSASLYEQNPNSDQDNFDTS